MRKELEDDLAVARIYSFRHEAELARSALEARGIEAIVDADDCGGQRPLMGATTGGVKLLVRRSDEGRAKQILE
ncbi:MAG TPA: hypothetical protein VKB26_01895 [Candidatus Acidoferrales bacterium]|nr:hypothetical protein [Candidatus Acidoferrales bacterium]